MTAIMLVGVLPTATATTTYTLTVNVVTSPSPTPNGLNVSLSNAASGAICFTQTSGGTATFTTSSCPGLSAGWWVVNLQPQMYNFAGNSWLVTPSNTTGLAVTIPYGSVSDSVTFSGVSVTSAASTVTGNVTGLQPGSTVHLKVLDQNYSGFAINSTSSIASSAGIAHYSITRIPNGSWTMYVSGPGASSFSYLRYNYTAFTVNSAMTFLNLSIQGYLVSGHYGVSGYFNAPSNITIWDETTHHLFTNYYLAANSTYYQMGLYPAGVGTTGKSQNFLVFLSPRGYNSAWSQVKVSAASPSATFSPAIHPEVPTNYSTTLTFGTNFSTVNVSSAGSLTSGSTFATLPNASVGNFWAQLGLDFNGSMPAMDSASYAAFLNWLNGSGPIYPAQAEGLAVNGSTFNDNGIFHLSAPAFPGNMSYSSTAGFNYGTSKSYSLSTPLKANASAYYLKVGFDYPLSSQNLSYTVNLPQGYVLKNNTAAPAGTSLIPSGPVGPLGKLWTSFTIVPHAYSQVTGSANLTIYKITNVTAVVNITSSNFAFSEKNVLNQTSGNYTVIVGAGQNVSLTASHSLVPATMNVTAYEWQFGDANLSSHNSTVHHIYKTGGLYHGTLTLLTSGGNKNVTKFNVYVDSLPPAAVISVNNTHVVSLNKTAGYVYLNWSQSLQFNASGSTDKIAPSVGPSVHAGIISVASWNITAGPTHHVVNFTVGQNANVFSNFTYSFLGAGKYVKNQTTIMNTSLKLTGWLYTVSLTLWDAGGNRANSTLYVLVNDTEKPIALGSVENSANKNITGGLVEGTNGTVQVKLLDKYSSDPHNGSLAFYSWSVTNNAGANISTCHTNATLKCYWNSTSAQTFALYLPASTGTYNFSLNVTDLAGNHANSTYPVTVAQNLTVRPVLSVSNITAPTTMTDGSQYTVWVNVNNTGYSTSKAENVTVAFYITNPDGSGKTMIGGSPNSVKWYGYTKGVVNSSASFTGTLPSMKANQSWRAEVTYTPGNGFTGTKELWANSSATNEFYGEYQSGQNVAHMSLTINPNPLTSILEYVAIAVAVVVVLVVVVLIYRRRKTGGAPTKKDSSKDKKPSKGDSGKEKPKEEDDEEEKA